MGYNSVADITGLSSLFCLAAVGSQSREIMGNSAKNLTLQQFKVIDLGVNRKRICDFLLVTNSNFRRYRFRDIDAWS